MEEKRVYRLTVQNGLVCMPFDSFAHLAGELTRYGVDVDVINQNRQTLEFVLKETNSE